MAKITIKQLRNIIKEEVENAMGIGGSPLKQWYDLHKSSTPHMEYQKGTDIDPEYNPEGDFDEVVTDGGMYGGMQYAYSQNGDVYLNSANDHFIKMRNPDVESWPSPDSMDG
jgi:hypothetical protein